MASFRVCCSALAEYNHGDAPCGCIIRGGAIAMPVRVVLYCPANGSLPICVANDSDLSQDAQNVSRVEAAAIIQFMRWVGAALAAKSTAVAAKAALTQSNTFIALQVFYRRW